MKKFTRLEVSLLYEKLNFYRKVAKKLNFSPARVKYLNSVELTQKSENLGRSTLLNERDKWRIQRLLISKPLVNVKQAYNEYMFSFSYNSFLRYIKLLGYSQQHVTKTPLIKKHKTETFKFCLDNNTSTQYTRNFNFHR